MRSDLSFHSTTKGVMKWTSNIDGLMFHLRSLSVRKASGAEVNPDAAFDQVKKQIKSIREKRNTVYFIGNGASASIASHVSADMAKNAHVPTEVFTDLCLITAIANDLSYEEVFAEPLRRRMKKGDMLVVISSSGNSPNLIRGAETARDLGGIVVTLSAMGEENKLRKMGTLNFYVPAQTYGMAETSHAAILHYWIDRLITGEERNG